VTWSQCRKFMGSCSI